MKSRVIAIFCVVTLMLTIIMPSIALTTCATEGKNFEIDAKSCSVLKDGLVVNTSPEDEIYLKAGDTSEYSFAISKNGIFNVKIYYRQNKTQYRNIGVDIKVDGNSLVVNGGFFLEHTWEYDSEYIEDIQGNQISPTQSPSQKVTYKILTNGTRDISPYNLNLSAGTHTLSVRALEEDVYICGVTLIEQKNVVSYDEYFNNHKKNGVKSVSEKATFYKQAEENAVRSDKSILVANERASVAVEPYDAVCSRYNVVGGENWSAPGSYIEWNITVPESGFYAISLHSKQNTKLNDNSYRMLTIDGELPFKEAENIEFAYDRGWNIVTVGSEEPYSFYFSADKEHTVRLTASTGIYSYLIEEVADLVARLNSCYLNILMITGSSPDKYRDYRFPKVIPETLKELENISKNLKKIEKEWAKYTEGGASLSDIQQMYQVIDEMLDDNDTIASRISLFNSYISSLQVWVDDRYQQPLTLDYLCFHSPNAKKPEAKEHFFKIVWHHLYQFITSFIMDYSAIGNQKTDATEQITVWLGADVAPLAAANGGTGGRDQSQIVTRLVTNDFTKKNGVSVNVQLVNAGSLLSAVLADIGPDVALGLAQGTPVNYALRNSIIDLSKMDGIEDVLKEFDESSYEPFKLNGGLYALPQSQSWSMLFYRKDVLADLGISTESLKTWDSIKEDVIPILKINYLEMGVSSTMNGFCDLLYQRGGQLYSDDHINVLFDSKESIAAFTDFTNLFLEHGLPVYFNFADRFRNGTMPIGIADYTTFNQIKVYAPEIEGLWSMIPVPCTVREDGSVDRSVVSSSEGCGIFKEDNIEASWKFLKWWVSSETQLTFSQELESLLGAAGRNPTANISARNQLGWSSEFRAALNEQSKSLVGIPEVAGGYYTSRYFSFAFTDVVYNGKNIIETITNIKKDIDLEISIKTEELLGKEKKDNEK